jgi:hypothetical protein
MIFSRTLLPFASLFLIFRTVVPAAELAITPSTEPVSGYPSGSPIPRAQDAPSTDHFAVIYTAWTNRVIVGEYRRVHPEDRNVPEFLGQASRYLWLADEPTRKVLSSRGEDLERMGCIDPAFQLMAGIVQGDVSKKEKLFRLAITGFPKTDYSRFLLFITAAGLGKSLEERKADAAEIAEVDRVALEALREGLNMESFHADEMPALRWRLTSESTENLLRRRGPEVADIFQHATNLPEWLREFGQGRGRLRAAWIARTGGWASEVPEAGWTGWQQNLGKARAHFTKAWELNPSDPAAAAYMIEVAMGDGGDKQEMRRWFDKSVAAQMDYWAAYRSLMWALRPRWHGSHAEMLQFADECLRTGRFDTCVPYYYLMTVDDISSEERDHKAIYQRPEISRNIRLALEHYFATPTMPITLTYAHTTAAVLEYKSGDLTGARAHMAVIQFQPSRTVGAGLSEEIPAMMKAVLAR